jgi:hypothetical protein
MKIQSRLDRSVEHAIFKTFFCSITEQTDDAATLEVRDEMKRWFQRGPRSTTLRFFSGEIETVIYFATEKL